MHVAVEAPTPDVAAWPAAAEVTAADAAPAAMLSPVAGASAVTDGEDAPCPAAVAWPVAADVTAMVALPIPISETE